MLLIGPDEAVRHDVNSRLWPFKDSLVCDDLCIGKWLMVHK